MPYPILIAAIAGAVIGATTYAVVGPKDQPLGSKILTGAALGGAIGGLGASAAGAGAGGAAAVAGTGASTTATTGLGAGLAGTGATLGTGTAAAAPTFGAGLAGAGAVGVAPAAGSGVIAGGGVSIPAMAAADAAALAPSAVPITAAPAAGYGVLGPAATAADYAAAAGPASIGSQLSSGLASLGTLAAENKGLIGAGALYAIQATEGQDDLDDDEYKDLGPSEASLNPKWKGATYRGRSSSGDAFSGTPSQYALEQERFSPRGGLGVGINQFFRPQG